ncbi:Arc family DNA-binding protein [Arsenophonus sp. aPb]|uniref:Arc family DNA-binding protein n=1 Tax=Arsenophonus sp. aPb TaxID=3041619 RepID=UPI0024684EED|nr:Arc family DNA-binding protein [Arsenophonus sp. aPb]WGL97230.1 Arc family DNA-binding protein [Arsenophonus sp. aPb]
MKKFPSQTQDKFTVRFPDGMRDAIAKRAEENGRSMNSEIVHILNEVLHERVIIPMDDDQRNKTLIELFKVIDPEIAKKLKKNNKK